MKEDDCRWYPGFFIYFFGASNAKGAGVGAVLVSETGAQYPVVTKLRFECTNKMVKYEACILGLRAALSIKIEDLLVFGDSDLIIHQVKGDWQTRDEKLLPYHRHLVHLSQMFDSIEFHHIPITPPAEHGHQFILVVISYFTFWIEAASYRTVPEARVVKFFNPNIICRYGVPHEIITDNAPNLDSAMMDRVCQQFKITHCLPPGDLRRTEQ